MASHGQKPDILAPRSRFYHGPFGRLFADLEPWDSGGFDFLDFAKNQMVERPGLSPTDLATPATVSELEAAFSSSIPAGYTYFGQFIDHDITFDPVSSLMRRNDPQLLHNFRTPRLDLDNLYGRGPDDTPYLYDSEAPGKLLTGEAQNGTPLDLPRNVRGRAIIGDPRNDENSIVSQLQLAFLRAHNTLVDRANANGLSNPFDEARRALRWLYQFVVWNDFLARVTDDDIRAVAMSLETTADGRKVWKFGLEDVFSWKNQPFMPVEFSVAAYRFGHSMVRNAYQTNDPIRGFQKFVPIFDNSGAADTDPPRDLKGFGPVHPANAIQWDWFLPMRSSRGPFPQMGRKIDTKLANALAHLHEDAVGSPLNVLAFRNLKRGVSFDMPAGTGVARKLGLDPVALDDSEPDSLWYYVLKEAEVQKGGESLGKVGSTIVCATFAGLLAGDPNAYHNVQPNWHPDQEPLFQAADKQDDGDWKLASVIRLSGLPVDKDGFP